MGILDRWFFFPSNSTPHRPLIHEVKPFCLWLRIRGENRQRWLHSGVNDTAVTLDLMFDWLWLPLIGISIEKTYVGKLYLLHL
jgi:hypothetical protein